MRSLPPQVKRRKTSKSPVSGVSSGMSHRAYSISDSVGCYGTKHPRKGQTTAGDASYNLANFRKYLPIEILQNIARYLPNDDDLRTFRIICRTMHAAVDGEGLSFWRYRFHDFFEKPLRQADNATYKKMYLERRRLLTNPPLFVLGSTDSEKAGLKILKDVFLDWLSSDAAMSKNGQSLNMEYLVRFEENADSLLLNLFRADRTKRDSRGFPMVKNSLLTTIRVILAPLMLRIHGKDLPAYSFPDSQFFAYDYSHRSPIFSGPSNAAVNMMWTLHQLNLWKFHVTRESEYTLYNSFIRLTEAEKPSFCRESLLKVDAAGESFGHFWKGSYLYLENGELESVRNGKGQEELIQDSVMPEPPECPFQDLHIELHDEGKETWPVSFERHLHALESPNTNVRSKTRAQCSAADSDSLPDDSSNGCRLRVFGLQGARDFLADGWLKPLPPQHGIPGFRRFVMMKYYLTEDGDVSDDMLWAYEGVVLPGTKVIVGRWWDPDSGTGTSQYSGPFMLWGVDPVENRFLRTMQQTGPTRVK